jgi:hypothetical protein
MRRHGKKQYGKNEQRQTGAVRHAKDPQKGGPMLPRGGGDLNPALEQ